MRASVDRGRRVFGVRLGVGADTHHIRPGVGDRSVVIVELGVPSAELAIQRSPALHAARHEINCVMHTHTAAGIAVSAQEQGLLPISQHAMRLTGNVAYHHYEGVALNLEERERLVADMGSKMTMILHNHGLLSCGKSVREALDYMYYLERACQAQVAALAGGAKLIIPSREIAESVARSFERPGYQERKGEWRALIRMLDKTEPSYKT